MPRRVVTARAAAVGLRAARRWFIQPGSGVVGQKSWQHILAVIQQLRDFPYLGFRSDEHPGCYRLSVEGYLIVYQIDPDTGERATAGTVTILAVFSPHIGQRKLP